MRGGARPGAGRPRGSRNKPAPPRPPLSPAKRVEVLVAAGARLERIAVEFELTVDELRDRFADEIEHGAARINKELLEVVYQKAMGGNVWAIKFLLRERHNR